MKCRNTEEKKLKNGYGQYVTGSEKGKDGRRNGRRGC